ncbi:MAG TPA: hypothetical protein VJS17_03535 [Pyrinomonadaceae bacterium]|nr:hypothetical protein [Pyrinomonadaceae bacterium]
MKKIFYPVAIACLLLMQCNALAQSQDVPKFEIGGEFITLEREGLGGQKTEPGVGARFTYNINANFALEAAGYIFPDRCFLCTNNGRMSQVVAGAKVGKRFDKWGIFAKARPGIVSFSEGHATVVTLTPGNPFPVQLQVERSTHFATELGGVVEFYPSRKIVTRFDVGDTLIHFKSRTATFVQTNPFTGEISLLPFVQPARTTHNFQFTAGVGFRF